MNQGSTTQEEWPVISSYSRAEALADGVLRDAGELAREAGLGFPVALTEAAWAAAVSPNGVEGQDEQGRLWDVLFMLRMSISRASGAVVRYQVSVDRPEGSGRISLKAVCGPGDRGEPVITVMLPGED